MSKFNKATSVLTRTVSPIRSVGTAPTAQGAAGVTRDAKSELFLLAGWLRQEANMRSASIVTAVEAVWARLQVDLAGGNRQLIDAVCRRADEPGEVLAYWTSSYGRAIPKPVKRGVADAVVRLYGERSLLKYDSDAAGFRFADVIDLVHPTPGADKLWQGDLFAHALDRRHKRDTGSGTRRPDRPTVTHSAG